MQSLKKPWWIFLVITLPQILLLAVLTKIFTVIEPLFDESQVRGWQIFGVLLLLLLAASGAYAGVSLLRKKEIAPWFGIPVFSAYIPLLYAAIMLRNDLIPSSVPGWMMFDLEPLVVLEGLTVPAFAYAMLLTAYWLTPKKGEEALVGNAVWVISIPICWYLLFIVGMPLLDTGKGLEHIVLVLFVVSSVLFLFFLTRIIFIFLYRKPDFWKKLIMPVVLIFPVAGLTLNHSTFHPFGNFSHPGFFIAAAVCGILLILPEYDNPSLRLLIFLGKMLLLPYTVYFFFVFLPYTPFSIVAIIGFGTGFLMLTPIALFLIHLRSLHIDFQYLRSHFTKNVVVASGILMLLIIPVTITGFYVRDRKNLQKAINIVYHHSYSGTEPVRINRNGVKRALSHIETNTRREGTILPAFSGQTPILSAWYRYIVMDNLTLSSDKRNLLKRVILGEEITETSGQATTNNVVTLSDIHVESEYDKEMKAWRSWLHLTLRNTTQATAEYATDFRLPEGSYIQNYYLYVGQEKKFGLVADKRAAEWIYRQIVSYRQDPGLLRYVGHNRLELRVFPFSAGEERKTGFEIIHKEPLSLVLGGKTVQLQGEEITEPIQIDDTFYLAPGVKAKLPTVVRALEWYFLVDATDKQMMDNYLERVKAFLASKHIEKNKVHIIAVNDNSWQVDGLEEGALSLQKDASFGGGFYIDKAVKTILYRNITESSPARPVFVVVTDNLNSAIIADDYDLWRAALPEGDEIVHLQPTGELIGYHLKPFPDQVGMKVDEIQNRAVYVWPDAVLPFMYLPADGEASIVPVSFEISNINDLGPITKWESGVLQQRDFFQSVLYPKNKTEAQFNLVKNSIRTGVLAPYTAYMVLENEAQENMLKEKQKQILSAKSHLDLGENLPNQTSMAEPEIFIVAVLFAGFLLYVKRKKQRAKG